jgi:putative ABC transport system permease protein
MPSGPIAHAWRSVRRSPGVLVLVVLTLALGIGGATAMFAVVDAVLLNPLPYANGDRLREVYIRLSPTNQSNKVTTAHVEAMRRHTETFAAVERYGMGGAALTDGEPAWIATPQITPGLLQLLGAAPIQGRLFTAEEADREDRVVLISERLWRTRFGGADVAGKRIAIEGVGHEIVGVLPARFAYPERTADLWHPLPANPRPGWVRRGVVVVLLQPGVSADAAGQALGAISASLARDGALERGATLITIDALQRRFGTRYGTELWVLLGAVLLVLVIGCVNVAHLLLARATGREGEFAVMAALGSGRVRIVGSVLVEAAVVAAVGGLAGALVARALLVTVLDSVPVHLRLVSAAVIGLDWRALGFTTGLAAATCLLVGALPAWRLGRLDLVDALKGRAPGAVGDGRERWHRVMVVGQLALTVTLLIATGLLLRSFIRLVHVSPGFDVDGRIVAEVQFPGERYRLAGGSLQVMQELDRRLEAVPGVRNVTFSEGAPPSGGSFSFDIAPEAEGERPVRFTDLELPRLTVAPDYFATLGIPLTAGRTFSAADGAETVIVNTVLARRFWGAESPIGRRFRLDPSEPWTTVIGVAGDVKQHGLHDPMGEGMEIYSPYPPDTRAGFYALTVRAGGANVATLGRRIRSELKALDPLLPVLEVATMEERLAESVARPRFLLHVCGLFAILAAVMAAVGVYGTTSFWVSRRRRELGLRLALGASQGGVVRLVLGSGLRLAALAAALGVGAALWLSDLVRSMLFETSPNEPVVLIATVAGALALVGIACALPALRASRTDPVEVLRAE